MFSHPAGFAALCVATRQYSGGVDDCGAGAEIYFLESEANGLTVFEDTLECQSLSLD